MNPGTLSEEERYLSAHIADMQRLAVKSGVPRFSMFLNERCGKNCLRSAGRHVRAGNVPGGRVPGGGGDFHFPKE